MHTLRYAFAVGAAMLVAGVSANAQLPRASSRTYPTAQTLPSGMCQVWIDGVPANRQPAPTDCTTARRNQPRNSRIIYGSGQSTNVYGNRDPRSIPGTPQYDPRFDPRSSQYDPRLSGQYGNNGRYNNGQYGNNGRYNNGQYGNNGRYNGQYGQSEKEQEKLARKQEKERQKEWKKAHKGNGNGNGDDHDDNDDRRGNGRNRDHS